MVKKIEACTERNCIQQTQIALMNQSMKNIEDKVDTILEELKGLDNKFASKQVEIIVYWILGLLFTGMASTLLYFVFNHVGLNPK